MDATFVEINDLRPLSTARRLFILQEMFARADAEHLESVTSRIRRLIEADAKILRLETGARRGASLRTMRHDIEQRCHDGLEQKQHRAHREFIALIFYVLSSYPSPVADHLLTPARQQLRRLRNFENRDPRSGELHRTAGPGDGELIFTTRPAT